MDSALMVTDNSRQMKPLEPTKLLISIYKSCQHRPDAARDAAALNDTCLAHLRQNISGGAITKSEIFNVVQPVLKNFDEAAAVHYSAFHKY